MMDDDDFRPLTMPVGFYDGDKFYSNDVDELVRDSYTPPSRGRFVPSMEDVSRFHDEEHEDYVREPLSSDDGWNGADPDYY